jgi:D-alanyl-D-alanine carboxypeptidase/D-alanyl-D-alanine-endopeptidase (penicillin-binding protein 4)
VASIAPDERFQPASNTKIFVSTAVFDAMAQGPFPNFGTQIRMEPKRKGAPDVALIGRGDGLLRDAADCIQDCLAALADAVVASGVKRVGDVIGDDSAMPFERWVISEHLRPGTRTIISALTINDNEFAITVKGAAQEGGAVSVISPDLLPEFTIVNEVATGPATAKAQVQVEMVPGERRIRLFGSLPAGGREERLELDVDDPADYAAIRLARLLRARGVVITGTVRPRHAAMAEGDLFATTPPAPELPALASLTPPDLMTDLAITSKVSQNLHAHLFLKKLALAKGLPATTPAGLGVMEQVIAKAGLARWTHDFYDGSGLSPDNRITPRAMVQYLHWVDRQPWAAQWRKTLPIAGVDGTLRRRFKGTPLEGRLFAKTGTLLATNALAGSMTTASGKSMLFAIYASDRPSGAPSVLPTLDAALNLIAAEN